MPPRCPNGSRRDKKSGNCVPKTKKKTSASPKKQTRARRSRCGPGTELDRTTKSCISLKEKIDKIYEKSDETINKAKGIVSPTKFAISELNTIRDVCRTITQWIKKHPKITKSSPEVNELDDAYDSIPDWIELANKNTNHRGGPINSKEYKEAQKKCLVELDIVNNQLMNLFSKHSFEEV